ncbi:acyl-CoA dehydrogenase family protein [Pseudonocardia sp.]|uniref:acyl-CoA dehydrogenase family protein n=1 Tax=Pseudonocardia sp. TaxID=60912 RepID=UPI003D0F882B
MFFALTEEQQEFGAAVAGYLADRFDLEAVRGVVEDADGDGHPAALWKAAAEQGWLAVTVPEEHDGLELGLVEAHVIARALGAGVAPGPWRGTVLAAEAIRLAGSPEQRATWLPRLAAGDAVGAVALRGEAGGTLPVVEYGAVADVVVARSGDGWTLVTGASAAPVGSYDGTVRLATLDGGTVEALTGSTDLDARVAVLVAADLAGVAREALTRTVAYDRDRRQFGVPVGSFQAIKHALADLHVAVTMAEHAALYAAHAVDVSLEGADLAVAVAKAKCSDAAVAATGAMIQYHGGIGYTWEHEAHFFYKRAKRLAGIAGTADAHRARIAELTIG